MGILTTKFFTDEIYNIIKGQEDPAPQISEVQTDPDEEQEPLFIGKTGYIPICKYPELQGSGYKVVSRQKGRTPKRPPKAFDDDFSEITEIGRFRDLTIWEQDGEVYSSADESPRRQKMHHKKVYKRRHGYIGKNAA